MMATLVKLADAAQRHFSPAEGSDLRLEKNWTGEIWWVTDAHDVVMFPGAPTA
jgi:hypothetical protein